MTSLAELCQIMPPPDVPTASTGPWAKVESQLRSALPSDYKQFIETYGTGNIGSLPITVNSPFAIEPSNHLIAAAEGICRTRSVTMKSGICHGGAIQKNWFRQLSVGPRQIASIGMTFGFVWLWPIAPFNSRRGCITVLGRPSPGRGRREPPRRRPVDRGGIHACARNADGR